MLGMILTFLIPVLVAIYTFRYAQWAAKRKLYRGAVGLYLLAAAAIAVPGLVYWWTA